MASLNTPLNVLPSAKRRNLFYAAFIVINLLLSCYYLDIWLTPNATSRALPVLTMYEDHSLQINKYKDYSIDRSKIKDHYYSDKAPLTSYIVFPFYALYRSLGLPELKDSTVKKYPVYMYYYNPNFDDRISFPKRYTALTTIFILGDILCGAIPFVLILVITLFAVKKTSSKVSPVIVVMMSFYASYLFAYAGTYTGHILSGLFALSGYIFIRKKNYVLSGLMIGFAMAIEFTVGFLIPVWVILIYFNERKVSKSFLFLAGLIPGIVFNMLYNLHVTGSPFTTTYSFLDNQFAGHRYNGFTYPKISALWGITFSLYRGAIIYSPILIVLLWYALRRHWDLARDFISGKGKELIIKFFNNYLLVTIITYLLLISSYFVWTGGWGFGPRHIIPLVIICLYEGVSFLVTKKINPYFFYIISFIGLLVIWLDKSTKAYYIPDDPAHFGNPVLDVILPDFFNHKLNTNLLPVFLFDTNPVIAIYLWPILFVGSLIFLTAWYSKLYPARKNNTNFFMPIICLIIIYIAILIPRHRELKNTFTLDFFGEFGGWKYYSLASDYKDSAESTSDQAKKMYYYSHAIPEFKKVIPFSPTFHLNYYNIGSCYYFEGYQDSALPALKKALQLNPEFSQPAFYLGIIYFNKARYDTAITYYNIAYKADSGSKDILINLAASYQNKKNYSRAFHYDSLLLKIDPTNKSAYSNMYSMHNNIGIQYVSNNEFSKALEEFSLALKFDPNSADAMANMGVAYQKMGDIEMAKSWYQRAMAKDPKNEEFAKNWQLLNAAHTK